MREQPKAQDATEAKMPEMRTMANPQATELDLAWLAGIWDGEGSITVRRNRRINQFSPRVSVVNTNAALLRRVCELLDTLGVKFAMFEKTKYPSSGIESKLQCWQITIETMKNAALLLNSILPYLVAKREQALLLRRFLNSRIERTSKAKRMSDAPYSKDELDCLEKVTVLNGDQRKSSEAIRTSSDVLRRRDESQAHLPIC